ncbi:MAG: hypothetical protein CL916_07865 [Deltaproteobacteria bacterium]|nr:hypothetical protein [Deltaproteobacteria bacterium]
MKDTKICPVCTRPFEWRKKWERNWENIRYCSKACRTGRYLNAKNKIKKSKKNERDS